MTDTDREQLDVEELILCSHADLVPARAEGGWWECPHCGAEWEVEDGDDE